MTLAPHVLMEIATSELAMTAEVEVVEEDVLDAVEEAVDVTWITITAGSEGTLLVIAGDQAMALKEKTATRMRIYQGWTIMHCVNHPAATTCAPGCLQMEDFSCVDLSARSGGIILGLITQP